MATNHKNGNQKPKIFLTVAIWLIFTALAYLSIFKSFNIIKLSHTIPMLTIIFCAFLLSVYVLKEMLSFPRLNKNICIFLVLSIIYLIIMTIFASSRFYYSRLFILLTFLISFILISTLFLYPKKNFKRRFIILYADNTLREQELISHGIEFISDFVNNGENYDGIVLKDFSVINSDIAQIITKEVYRGVPIISFAELYSDITGKIPLESFKPSLMRTSGTTIIYKIIKRLLEQAICLVSLIPSIIIGFIISIMIVIDNGLPIFFIQERVGYKGKVFRLIKFRTMKKDAESNGPAFANLNDDRITRVGKIIRKLRLDELPQVINVLKGDMSLIGPRPEQVPFAQEFENSIPFYSLRYNIRPGLTGWAQIHSGYAANNNQTREKLEFDLYYLFNQSIFLDLIIIFKTIRIVFTGYGAV